MRKGDVRSYYWKMLEQVKRELMIEALIQSAGNRTKAAKYLGITARAVSFLILRFDLKGSLAKCRRDALIERKILQYEKLEKLLKEKAKEISDLERG